MSERKPPNSPNSPNSPISKVSNDPLHGKTLQAILIELVEHHGWPELGRIIDINCFKSNPSIKSSLTFLRRNSWAREHVEALYRELVTRVDRGGGVGPHRGN